MFFLLRDGKPTGPFTIDLLRQMLETGMVQQNDQVRKEDESEWLEISAVLTDSEKVPEPVTKTIEPAGSDQTESGPDQQHGFLSQLPNGGKIAVAIGGVLGFVGDFLEPLAPFNFYLFVIALVATAGLFISWRRLPVAVRGDWGRMFPQQSMVFSAFVLISLTAWYCLGFIAGGDDRGVVAGNVSFVANWQDSVLGLQKDVEEIKETVDLVQKDTTELKQSAKNIETDTEQIRRDTGALKQDTASIKENTAGIKQATEATAKSMQQVDSKLESIDQSVQGIGSLGGLIADPKTKFDYLHNASVYRKRNDFASAREAYLQYFSLETGDFVDSYSGYWDLLESQFQGESTVGQLYQELLAEKPNSIAGPFVSLVAGATENDETTRARLIELYKANPEFVPALPVVASLMASNELYDRQRVSRIQQEYLRRGGFEAASKFLLRPDESQSEWVLMLRRFGQLAEFDLSKFVSVDTYADQYIQLLGIEIRDVKPPRQMTLTFPDKTVVTVPFGAENPAGADSLSVLFELQSGKQGRYRFEPRSPNDQRIFKHCGKLYGLGSTPIPVDVEIIDSRGRSIQFPEPLSLGHAQFTTKIVKPHPLSRNEGSKLQIIPSEFVKSCGISLAEDGPYVDVPMHVDVPTKREIRLEHITNLPLRAGEHHVWIKAETNRGAKLGPQLVTIEIPAGLPGLTGGRAPGPPKPPLETPDAEWQFSAEAVLTFSPDGRRLAVANHAEPKAGTVVQVIDTQNGELVATINHERVITTVALSSKAEWLAAASSREKGRIQETDRDTVVTLTKIATGEQVELTSRPDPVFALAFSPDDKILAAGQRDPGRKSLIRLWNTASHEETEKLTGHSAQQITSLAFSPDGRHLAASNGQFGGGGVGDVMIWALASRQKTDTYRGDPEGTASLVYSPTGDQLLVGSNGWSPSVRLWDLQTGEDLAGQFRSGGRPTSVAFRDENLPLITHALNERNVTVWNALSGQKIIELKHYGLKTLALSPDGRSLVTGGKTVKKWSLDK